MIARIDADREAHGRFTPPADFLHGRHEQSGGQIVDAVIAEIFKDVQRNGLSRSGKPADDDQAQFA